MSADIIGTIYTWPDGYEEEPVAEQGWFVIVETSDMVPALSSYVDNRRPLPRVWAGDDPFNPEYTVLLKFNTEQEATTLLTTLGLIVNEE